MRQKRLPAEQIIRRGIVGSDNGKTQMVGYLLDSVLANNGNPAGGRNSGYQFTSGTGAVFGTVNSGYTTFDPAGACSSAEATILTFNPLNQ